MSASPRLAGSLTGPRPLCPVPHQSAIHLLPAGRGACVECLATSTIPTTSFSWSLRLGQQTATTTHGTLNMILMLIVASL